MNPEACTFLNQRSQIFSFLAYFKNKEDLLDHLKSNVLLLEGENIQKTSKAQTPSSSASSSCDLQDNEDDCFDINIDED